jgi:hypothetical protein
LSKEGTDDEFGKEEIPREESVWGEKSFCIY